ncbi:MAG: hypothetical protein IT168_12835, partial [Bryobacterales bacterium]|nr:hypothetical protein [Bryobacterales bacterium]
GGTVVAETLPLPTELAGVSVSFNGHAGRILSISSTSEGDQINVQVPARCTLGGRRGNGGISMDDPERRWW